MFWVVFTGASAVACVFAYGMVDRYLSFKLHRHTHPFVLVTLFANMTLLLSITYLLPLDVFYSNQTSGREDERPELPNLALFWAVIYWAEFVICWLVFPVLISYVDLKYLYPREPQEPGRRSVLRRLRGAVICNLKFYGLCLLGVICGLVYLKTTTDRGASDIKPLLIALSHLYSLLYMLVLLALGLVLLPQSLLREGSDERRLFVELSQDNDALNEARLNMTDYAEKIISLPSQMNGDVTLEQVINSCKLEVNAVLNELSIRIPELLVGTTHSSVTLAKVNDFYNSFITEYYNYTYHQSRSDKIIHTLAVSQNTSGSVARIIRRKLMGFATLILSLLVALLEVTPAKFAHSWVFWGNTWWHFVVEIALLVYCTVCSLYAMSKFKFLNFHLIANGSSNPRNALYYSLYSSRLLLPLCFNFITLIPSQGRSATSGFEKALYKELEVIPFVKYLNLYLPVVVIILVPLAYHFDFKGKILLKMFGEEYYHEFFGTLYYPSHGEEAQSRGSGSSAHRRDGRRSRVVEDLEYSLQDGRYLFERATNNYALRNNRTDNPAASHYV
ncbi:AER270C-Ap [Eremothecium gossypii ATCC 10895]|uniref:AER270C-Ap n=1 Tax=Eremothecium gossypii (strain ATCC 10895 / CBS 109.51 / FGSC 9923 / NRRL Y-1056) TaxID=284811 RepID=D8FGD7_EREGS|nr:AER270C-Ap [Eremothecium gossypii ATCC 10895]ADJ41780.1 AER270C-Ap [Eremothecium gossypii ATCC 10895]